MYDPLSIHPVSIEAAFQVAANRLAALQELEMTATLNLFIMHELCNPESKNILANRIATGLDLLGARGKAEEIIADLTGVKELKSQNRQHLPIFPYEMAYTKPQQNFVLGNIFANALQAAQEAEIVNTAAHNLYIIHQLCDPAPGNMVADRIKTGLNLLGMRGKAEEIIADLTGVKELKRENRQHLPLVPYQMAYTKPQQNLMLGNIFANALQASDMAQKEAVVHTAAFNLYVIRQMFCDPDPLDPLACRTAIGLMSMGMQEVVKNLISDITGIENLADENEKINSLLPDQMAEVNPGKTLMLGRIFADALERQTFEYARDELDTAVPQNFKSETVSNMLAPAFPALARLFQPKPASMYLH